MGSQGTAPAPASGSGLQDNVAGMLVYLVGILAIVFLVIEPYNKNKFVRFHSFQCLFYWGAVIAASIALTIASFVIGMVPVVGGIIDLVLWLALWGGMFVGWVMLMVKAYQGQMWQLPVIGKLAADQAGK
jgi:uncharacterized membrane protein